MCQLDQLQHDEQQVMRLEAELTELRRNPPEKGVKLRVIQDFCEKEEYLQFEVTEAAVLSYHYVGLKVNKKFAW